MLDKLTVIELKALSYDLVVQIQGLQSRLNEVTKALIKKTEDERVAVQEKKETTEAKETGKPQEVKEINDVKVAEVLEDNDLPKC